MVFKRIREAFSNTFKSEPVGEDYLEIDLEKEAKENKVLVKVFVLKQYDDVNNILNSLREGYTIAIVDFRILKQKDPIELKRAISKIKKTVDALEGNIAGHENIVIITPSFAKIEKHVATEQPKKEFEDKFY
ncbi:MAG TPA: cell division protein SepF [Candidatus Nanoarchaeia archaeon]|nr:cell division protein SepF [Candidatus Nanoarchaeia archaeon]